MDKSKLHFLIISLGSNIHTEEGDTSDALLYLEKARERLSEHLEDIRTSDISTTKAIGINASDFCNQLICGYTALDVETLSHALKETEREMGRRRTPHHEVAIDIDLLKYDGDRYHEPDWQRDYVKDLLGSLPAIPEHNSKK